MRNIHDIERSVSYPVMPSVHVSVTKMEMKIVTTEAGTVGLIFGPGHL